MEAVDETHAGILVPVDFSPCSRAALAWAAQAAAQLGLPLEILHVVHDPESQPGYYQTTNHELGRLEQAAASMLDSFVDEMIDENPDLGSLPSARKTLVVGLPVKRILEVAEQTGAQLIVVGSQGRTGLPRLFLGSKAQRVAQLSPVPVTLVKQDRSRLDGGLGSGK